MKQILVFSLVVAAAGLSACRSISRTPATTTTAPLTASGYSVSTSTQTQARVSSFKPLYVFTDEKKENRFSPSGWMGDTQDIKLSGSYQTAPGLGKTCLKISYLAKGPKEWSGIYWQNPANNWGNLKGGYDIRGAEALTFWARGEKGGERISELKIGGLSGKRPDSDVAWIGPIELSREWTQYRIELKNKDLRYICGGFCFTVLRADNPRGCTFYLDEIRYE